MSLGKYNEEVEANKKFRRVSRVARYFSVDVTIHAMIQTGRDSPTVKKEGVGRSFGNSNANGLRRAGNDASRVESFAKLRARSDLVERLSYILNLKVLPITHPRTAALAPV